MKVEKNYYRRQILDLENENQRHPIIFTGKYKHTADPRWITFTTIRRYNPREKTQTVCNHINLEREAVARYLSLSEKEHNRKFYIYGRVSTYNHYGNIRGCIILADTCSESPIWMTSGSKSENERMVQRRLQSQQGTVLDGIRYAP